MTQGQWRVFGLLLVAVALTFSVAPKARKMYGDITSGNWGVIGSDLQAQSITLIAYALAFLILIALADPAPGLATVFVLLLITEQVLANADAIGSFINTAAKGTHA